MALTVKQIERVKQLRSSMVFDAVLGNYKAYKTAKKEYASLAVKDFDTVRKLPAPKATVPLFSKQGLNMMMVAVRDFFRIKTPEEKLLKKMGTEYKNKLNARKFIQDV